MTSSTSIKQTDFDVFINYSRKNIRLADAICHILEQHKIKCWIDYRNLLPGEDFDKGIINGIRSSKIMVLVFTCDANQSTQVFKELNIADKSKKVIIPFIADDVPMNKNFEYYLSSTHWLTAYPNPEESFDKLIKVVYNVLGRSCFKAIEEHETKKAQEQVDGIEVFSSPSHDANTDHKIFISYKRVDKDVVFDIKDKIEQNTGQRCWIDLEGIESDAQFANVICNAINKSQVFLFMYSQTHTQIEDYENDWTVREINFAQKKKKRIVFLNIDNSQLTDWFELVFGGKQQIDTTSNVAMEKLYKDLKKWLE